MRLHPARLRAEMLLRSTRESAERATDAPLSCQSRPRQPKRSNIHLRIGSNAQHRNQAYSNGWLTGMYAMKRDSCQGWMAELLGIPRYPFLW